MKKIPYLLADEDRQVERKSSISQYRGMLSVWERGGWTPIYFDAIDYIDCGKVVSHPAILATRHDFIGYHYPIGVAYETESEYLTHDHYGVEIRPLPEEVGSGFHEEVIDARAFTNADNGALGVENKSRLKVGLDYYLAKETLKGE